MRYDFGIQIGPREINKKLINLVYKSALFKLKSENKILNSLSANRPSKVVEIS